MSFALFMVSYCTKFRVGAASYKNMLMLEFYFRICQPCMLGTHCAFHNIFRLIIRQPMTTVLPFLIKGPPRSPLLLMICRPFGFFILVDKSIGSGCFFPGLDPSVNLIGHATITEMIKLQFTTITNRI